MITLRELSAHVIQFAVLDYQIVANTEYNMPNAPALGKMNKTLSKNEY